MAGRWYVRIHRPVWIWIRAEWVPYGRRAQLGREAWMDGGTYGGGKYTLPDGRYRKE